MTSWIPTLVAVVSVSLLLVCLVQRQRAQIPAAVNPETEQPASGHRATLFAAAAAPAVARVNLPILLVPPICRERLKHLSPFVIGGWDSFKSRQVAAWLRQIGEQHIDDPWALILWAPEDSVALLLRTYGDLPGWRLFVNEHPPADETAERVYLVEDVWHFPQEDILAPDLAEVSVLAELGVVIIVPDPEGMVPGYLEPARELANHMIGAIGYSHVIGLAGFPLGTGGNNGQSRGDKESLS